MNYFIQILCFLSILIVGCGDDYNFPNVNVNESVPITMPQYNNVYGNLWGYEFINGGLGGIIIVQGLDNEFLHTIEPALMKLMKIVYYNLKVPIIQF